MKLELQPFRSEKRITRRNEISFEQLSLVSGIEHIFSTVSKFILIRFDSVCVYLTFFPNMRSMFSGHTKRKDASFIALSEKNIRKIEIQSLKLGVLDNKL